MPYLLFFITFFSLMLFNQPVLSYTDDLKVNYVNVNNFVRAQSDVYFLRAKENGGFGKFKHDRQLMDPQNRKVIIRPNRDTLYSFGVFDLNAGSVTIRLPKGAQRFFVMQVINEDQYTRANFYKAGSYTITRQLSGTRYAMIVVRYLVDFSNKKEVALVHDLQNKIHVYQKDSGDFQIPNWDLKSLNKVKTALLQLGETLTDTNNAYGFSSEKVDPIKHLVASAILWGGDKDAVYYPITPKENDGKTIYQMTIKNVPTDGFWSVTAYDKDGYFIPNKKAMYSLNNLSAKKETDGKIIIQFGGCISKVKNCIPITSGWNYTFRIFKPTAEVLKGDWVFPIAEQVISSS